MSTLKYNKPTHLGPTKNEVLATPLLTLFISGLQTLRAALPLPSQNYKVPQMARLACYKIAAVTGSKVAMFNF